MFNSRSPVDATSNNEIAAEQSQANTLTAPYNAMPAKSCGARHATLNASFPPLL